MTRDKSETKQKKLKMTHDDVIGIFVSGIESYGVDETDAFFEMANKFCSILPGWSGVVKDVRSIIAEAKKIKQEEEFAKELALKKAAASNILLMSQNEASAMKETKKLLNHDVTMTGDHAVYNENSKNKE